MNGPRIDHHPANTTKQEQVFPNPDTEGGRRRLDPATATEQLENSGTENVIERSGGEGDGQGQGQGQGGQQERGEGEGEGEGPAEAAEDNSAYDAAAAAAYAEAMYQWGEYGTGPYPNDDGTDWLAVRWDKSEIAGGLD